MYFPTDYNEILHRIDKIDPVKYSETRNYINGDVTYLSPYISRGVISVKQLLDSILAKGYNVTEAEKFIQELAWREYFQRIWQHLEDDMLDDIRHRYTGIKHRFIPLNLLEASTGIESIDKGIQNLQKTGYMHNHLRMYTASVACNIAKSHWQTPAQWMYYHLLDGDIASNICSWQWVAGSFSNKQYFCNQENINKYTGSKQQQTFLDKSYEELTKMEIPAALTGTKSLKLITPLPEKTIPEIDNTLPLHIYTSYNLDPLWRQNDKANRILLLEPSHFKQFPVSEKVINFIVDLSKNIEGLQIFSGEINEIPGLQKLPAVYSKEHPAFNHFPGIKDERDWLFPEVKGFYNSFFSFWKKCKPYIQKNEKKSPELLRA